MEFLTRASIRAYVVYIKTRASIRAFTVFPYLNMLSFKHHLMRYDWWKSGAFWIPLGSLINTTQSCVLLLGLR